MARPVNPYVAGNPVGNSPAFVGRADVLREVLRVLRRPQDNAIVLYGQRRIGKTSILQRLAVVLPQEGPYRAVYFDLQDKAAWPLGRVLQDLARTIANALGRPDPDLRADPEATFRQEWLPVVLGDLPEGYSLVLLFDEFDVLADPQAEQAAAAFFPYLRDLLASDPQRLQFVFVIGRNVGDLTTIALSLFKGTPARRISLLSQKDTADLVRFSEANGTLRWPDEAMERVWQWTCGHPFLTQQLCSHVWEQAYDEEPSEPPTAITEDVDAMIPDTLEASRHALEWLWDGLPPAERVVASALAEAGPGSITREALERLLLESGVRIVVRELQNAPGLLQDWDLIEPSDGGYRFPVELLRRWIAKYKPLKRVQEELDRTEPIADNLYRVGLAYYRNEQFEQAIGALRQAIGLNPNHVGANQLLADILLAQGQPGEAQQVLERLYEYQPAAARPRLVQALLAQAQVAESDDERLAIYERVSELDSTQPEATAGRRNIWQRRGDAALVDDDLEATLHAYREAGLADRVAEVEQEMRRRALATRLQELEALEQARRYQDALNLARQLADEYLGVRDWSSDLERLERQARLADLYQRGLGALQSGDQQTAQTLLAQVVAMEPGYEDATRYLHFAVTGVDVDEIQRELCYRALTARLQELETLEREECYCDALDLVHKLAEEYAGMRDWSSDLERLKRKTYLADLYQRGLEALKSGDKQTAQSLLAQVVALEPQYNEATRYMHLAVTGVDVASLQAQLEAEKRVYREAETRIVRLEHRDWARVQLGEARTSKSNPFFCSGYVSLDRFIDRGRELRRITARIINQGQSTAIIGGPHSGKTSLLRYLAASEMRTTLYGAYRERLVFSYVDIQTLSVELTQAQFWEYSLRPLYEKAIVRAPDSSLAQVYQTCQENNFRAFVLERLLAQMETEGWRLVLLLDEFSDLLHHPILNSAEFFGSLRSLASRCSALSLVIASRHPLTELNEATQQLSRTGSPYFNFLDEIILGPWSNKNTASLLDLARGRFNPDDLRFIKEVSGEHPYLLQVLAFELWEAYEAGKEEPNQRRQEAGYKLYYEAVRILDESWRLWSSETRQAFTTIGLAHISSLMQREDFGKVVIQPNGPLYSEKGGLERRRLHQLFVRHFDTEELRAICFDLGEDYDSLPGEGKAGKARELIAYLERRGRISELAAVASEMRPDVCSDITMSLVHQEDSFAFQAVAPERLMRDFRPELSSLARRGFVREDTAVPGGWRVHPGAFLWWLADEVGTPEEGAAILIEVAAKGVGEGVAKGVIGG